MITVATVLKSGGDFTPFHVCSILEGLKKFAPPEDYEFVCLSDYRSDKVRVIPLLHDWPGWWSKIELFRPGIFSGPVFYLDLDTLVVGPWLDLARGNVFTVLRNFWVRPGHPRIGSGLMAWDATGDPLAKLYSMFRADPKRIPGIYVGRESWGDQGFIQANAPLPMERWQDKFPGRVVSYKKHCQQGVPEGASVVCFHGRPRPWHTDLWERSLLDAH